MRGGNGEGVYAPCKRPAVRRCIPRQVPTGDPFRREEGQLGPRQARLASNRGIGSRLHGARSRRRSIGALSRQDRTAPAARPFDPPCRGASFRPTRVAGRLLPMACGNDDDTGSMRAFMPASMMAFKPAPTLAHTSPRTSPTAKCAVGRILSRRPSPHAKMKTRSRFTADCARAPFELGSSHSRCTRGPGDSLPHLAASISAPPPRRPASALCGPLPQPRLDRRLVSAR